MIRPRVAVVALTLVGACQPGQALTDPGSHGGAAADSGSSWSDDSPSDPPGDAGADADDPCVILTCPAGFDCVDGYCQDGTTVLVPYDLAALRADPALDLTIFFDPASGSSAIGPLAILDLLLSVPAAQVPKIGAGSYRALLADNDPWWATEPLFLSRSRSQATVAQEGAATSVLAQTYQDMGWSLWQNAIGDAAAASRSRRQAFIDAGMPVLGYLEGTGNLFVYLATVNTPTVVKIPGTDITQTPHNHWSWEYWRANALPGDQRVIWIGPHTFYDQPAYAVPYVASHPTFGDPVPPTDPDGNPIVGTPAAETDPRQHALYRQCAATDLNGEPSLDLHLQGTQDVTGLPGVVTIGGQAYSILGFARDPACPAWQRYHASSLRYAVDKGTVGSWMDNVSMWDAWGLNPAESAFGAHATRGFEAWLQAHATSGFMTRSGLAQHAGAMNMRCIVKWKARTGFGDNTASVPACSVDIASNHAGLADVRWDADMPWGAWMAYQADLHVTYYQSLRAMLDALDSDFLWGVNDAPTYAGVVQEAVPPSMSMGEQTLGFHLLSGGVDLPPNGSLSPIYDLAGAFDLAQFQTVWLYVDSYLGASNPTLVDQLRASVELHRTLAGEALSYDAFLMPSDVDERAPGTTTSAHDLSAWIMPHARDLEGRRLWTRVGLACSPDSWLRRFRPSGVPSISVTFETRARTATELTPLHEFLGWHRALSDAGQAPRVLLAPRIDAEALADLDVLFLPGFEVLPELLRDEVLQPWVEAGGTLVVSGRAGRYRGRAAMYEPYDPTAARPIGAAALTGVADLDSLTQMVQTPVGAGRVVAIPGAPGADRWLGRASTIDAMMSELWVAAVFDGPIVTMPSDPTIAVRVHVDPPRGRLFLDLVNRDFRPASDTLVAKASVVVRIRRPRWLPGAGLTWRTAANRGTATVTDASGDLVVSVSPLTDIVTVIVESALP
ncbi:MAG: hypothetical protein HY903_22640 [Deltaproteobacteria bacterium]|nr:hypothetical protein [Deltaproteobacteria bacterium]